MTKKYLKCEMNILMLNKLVYLNIIFVLYEYYMNIQNAYKNIKVILKKTAVKKKIFVKNVTLERLINMIMKDIC